MAKQPKKQPKTETAVELKPKPYPAEPILGKQKESKTDGKQT